MLGFLFGIDKKVTIFAAFKLYISVGECVCQGCRHFFMLESTLYNIIWLPNPMLLLNGAATTDMEV